MMRKIRMQSLRYLMPLFAFVCSINVYASESSDTVVFFYRAGSTQCDPSYRGNGRELNSLRRIFQYDTTLKIKRITVIGAASPEGDYENNLRLARVRAQNVIDRLRKNYSWLFVDGRLPVNIETTANQSINNRRSLYEDMRYAAVYVEYDVQPTDSPVQPIRKSANEEGVLPIPVILPVVGETPDLALELTATDSVPEVVPELLLTKKPLFALKTNLLFDLVSALNLEIEIPIGRQWSIAVEGVFPWWLWDSKQLCLQMISGHVEGRYWFDRREDRPLLTGWFIGLYGGYGYYDFEYNKKGIQGEFRDVGISGGYGHRIGKNLSLEYSIGLGYAQNNYRRYEARLNETNDWVLHRMSTEKYDWFGPTRFKVSLVWMLNHGKEKVKKHTK